MTRGVSTRLIAACCGLSAFATAVVAGLGADNPLDDILIRAVMSLLLCSLVGFGLGAVAERTVADAIRSYTSPSARRHSEAANVPDSTSGTAQAQKY